MCDGKMPAKFFFKYLQYMFEGQQTKMLSAYIFYARNIKAAVNCVEKYGPLKKIYMTKIYVQWTANYKKKCPQKTLICQQ